MDMDPSELNAPDYLFVSYQLARHYPHLAESVFVLQYRSQLPGSLGTAWQKLVSKYHSGSMDSDVIATPYTSHAHVPSDVESNLDQLEQQSNNPGMQAKATDGASQQQTIWPPYFIVRVLTYISYLTIAMVLQLVVFAPLHVQSLFIRVLEPVVLSSVLLLFLLISTKPIYLALTIVLLIALVASVVWEHVSMVLERRRIAASSRQQDIQHIQEGGDTTNIADMLLKKEGAHPGKVSSFVSHFGSSNRDQESMGMAASNKSPSPISWQSEFYDVKEDEAYSMSSSDSSSLSQDDLSSQSTVSSTQMRELLSGLNSSDEEYSDEDSSWDE
ncbi:hypothetical protein EON63_17475 [archaeon]|nr:MAG: hypothetical protein EON63_17475 [archaeon]